VTKGAATAAPDVVVIVDVSAAEVVRMAIAGSIRRLARAEPIARAGVDPEGVHRMRVATRRLRSDLRSFAGVLEPAWAESLRRELRWLARALGGAREADVRGDRIGGRLRPLSPAEVAAAEPFRATLGAEATASAEVLHATLGSARYVALRARLEEAGRDPRPGPSAAEPALPVLAPLVHRRFRAHRREVAAAGNDAGDATLHMIRIRAKRVRYAAEALVPVGVPEVARFAGAARRVQGVLGAHQDAVATASWLTSWADGRSGQAAAVTLALRLAAAERDEADEVRDRWPQAWRRLDDPALRRWM
jgi:CHAD domain-containing protein